MPTPTASEKTPLVPFLHGSAVLYKSDKVPFNVVTALRAEGALVPADVLHEAGPLREALEAAGVEVHVATVVKVQRGMLVPACRGSAPSNWRFRWCRCMTAGCNSPRCTPSRATRATDWWRWSRRSRITPRVNCCRWTGSSGVLTRDERRAGSAPSMR